MSYLNTIHFEKLQYQTFVSYERELNDKKKEILAQKTILKHRPGSYQGERYLAIYHLKLSQIQEALEFIWLIHNMIVTLNL